MDNSDFWDCRISSWLNMGKKGPRRMICIIDDQKEHDMICELAHKKIPVMDVSEQWDLFPERKTIITGNVNMLLSRALNRGYGLSSGRWSIQFGLLHNDVIWCVKQENHICNALQQSRQRLGTYNSFQHIHQKTTSEKNMDDTIKRFFDVDNGKPADVEYLIGEKPPAEQPETRKKISGSSWVTLQDHLSHTTSNMKKICGEITCGYTRDLLDSARHHDWAKSHPVFQNALLGKLDKTERISRSGSVWGKRRPRIKIDTTGFFHDLVGGCAMISEQGHSALSSYLVISHHGRFRTSIPDIVDKIPATNLGGGIIKDEINIDVTGEKYRKMFAGLYKNHGPFILAYLEALLRVADIRTSMQEE